MINRAPVLTLSAAVVAKRFGFDWEESLTLGKAVAGLNAQSKGRRLGIFHPVKERPAKARKERPLGKVFDVDLCNRRIPAVNTDDGVRAAIKGKPIDPASVERYLESKVGENLDRVRNAMKSLAKAVRPSVLAEEAFHLYEQIRPAIPSGVKGWGAKGALDLKRIRSLA